MATIDLDLLVGEPLTVTLGGTQYKLPADCPIPVALKTQYLAEKIQAQEAGEEVSREDADKAVKDLYDVILDLFQVHQPGIESLPLGTVQLLTFTRRVYGGGIPDAEEGEGDA